MKILHAADLHLDTPFTGQAQDLKKKLLTIPGQIADLCRREGCELMLLAGDLFDGPWTKESLDVLRRALREAAVPVFISPGNHDFCAPDSPYIKEVWPENVHIFTRSELSAVTVDSLDLKVYGAGFESMDCAPLLESFRAEGPERYHIAVLHGDPTQRQSPYCPITAAQVQDSGLHYLALGHIHKTGAFRGGETLCAWPGCPMGRGYDEQGTKGVLIVTLDTVAESRFVPLEGPRFYDYETEAGDDPATAIRALLPAAGSEDFIRITLTGEADEIDLDALYDDRFPHLLLRDKTRPRVDVWSALEEDTLEGAYFRLLKDAMSDPDTAPEAELVARISRTILDGGEVDLP